METSLSDSAAGPGLPSSLGTPQFHSNMLCRMFFTLQERAGLSAQKVDGQGRPCANAEGQPILKPKYGFHTLRHAAAIGLIAQRIYLNRLQVWMGHESIKLTLDTYGHLLKDAEKEAEPALEASRDLFGYHPLRVSLAPFNGKRAKPKKADT